MLSYWERDTFIASDYTIIGSGIVGLSTAASLLEHQPEAKVLVLERGIFPTGASTKNAGFACFGSLTELLAGLQSIGEEKTIDGVRRRWEGLQSLIQRLGKINLAYEACGGYELITEEHQEALAKVDEINQLLFPLFNQNVFEIENKKIRDYGFSKHVKGLIFNKLEGALHTGKMMQNLAQYVARKGGIILTGAQVKNFTDHGHSVSVSVENPVMKKPITFQTKKLALCTNAFTNSLLPHIQIRPGRGQVLITKPIKNLKIKGCFHIDEGFYYFRNVEDRILLGGGRNKDFDGETSHEFKNTDLIINDLSEKLSEIILPGCNFEIDYTWSGIMAFNQEKTPILKKISDNIAMGVALNGMGVAIGSSLGEELHQIMIK